MRIEHSGSANGDAMRHKKATYTRRQFLAQAGGIMLTMGWGMRQARGQEKARKERAASKRPNLLVLVTDDQRWDAMGCMGNPIIRTPHMDRLAEEGVIFVNNFCTTSICMSSRASIFTGMYTRRHGINRFDQPLSEEHFVITYPVLLRGAGYRTGFIGKWGLGGRLPKKAFDFFEGFGGQGRYFHEVNGKTVHLTRILTEQALEFLRGCSRDQPFCLSISFKAPHVQDNDPRQFLYDPALEELYSDVTIPTPKTADPRYFESLPEFLRDSEGRRRWQIRFSTPEKYQESVKGYYRLITGVDLALGRIWEALREMGFDGNTVILLTSDNGFFLGEHGLAGKWLMYEESIRTPLIVRDPRLPSSRRGRRRKEMTLNVDLAPTLLDLAGVPIPSAMQGRSLRPLIEGKEVRWREDWFYEHLFEHPRIPKSEGIRTSRWKYIRYVDYDPPYEELYDLANDPHEEHNVIGESDYSEVLSTLRRRWREMRESLK
ncbi:TPA: DUF4976 domain-containing protein [Candidatus Poribacteria bacterium]|nr:DUF4976 domain-containing protein [Candidatus Poribacteria bacterium]HEX28880.1 DUF4976 domain-containing protein [Candidatus Poribacteria bacterium]